MGRLYVAPYDRPVALRLGLLIVLLLACARGAAGAGGEPVLFLASDAVPVEGRLYGGDGPAVLLVAGEGRSPGDWGPLAERLAASGFRVLAFAVRPGAPSLAARDLRGGLARLAAERTAVVGEAEGASAALWLAVEEELAGVVALSPVAAGGLEERLRRVGEAKLLMGGPGERELLRTLSANAPPPLEIRSVRGEPGLGLLAGPEGGRALTDILAFLRRVLEVP